MSREIDAMDEDSMLAKDLRDRMVACAEIALAVDEYRTGTDFTLGSEGGGSRIIIRDGMFGGRGLHRRA